MELITECPDLTASFYHFARMKSDEQQELLNSSGILVDTDFLSDRFIHLYFLNGFFVEVTVCPETDKIDIVPFKQGYRMESYFKRTCVLVPKLSIPGRQPGFIPCSN